MNNKGFTMFELLSVITIIAILFAVSYSYIRGTAAITTNEIERISERSVFSAATNYAIETNAKYNSEGYTCIKLQELIDYGYLKDTKDGDRLIKITRNPQTMVIEKVAYVDTCE